MMFSENVFGLDPEFCLQLTTALLHFLWQGTLLGGLAWLLASASQSARWRYTVNLGALVLMFACVPVTFLMLGDSSFHSVETMRTDGFEIASTPILAVETPFVVDTSESQQDRSASVAVSAFEPATNTPQQTREQRGRTLADYSPIVAMVYGLGVVLLMGRLLLSVCSAQQLRWRSTVVSDSSVLAAVKKCAERMQLRVVPTVATCTRISAPVVVGFLRPTILLPASLLSGLTTEEVAAILTHEIAHLRRNDLFVNLFQRIVESFLFFHPCVWLVSRQVSREREKCCDDLVLDSGCERMSYVSALLRMAEISLPAKSLAEKSNGLAAMSDAAVLSATGPSPSEFKRRVLRLLGEPSATPRLSLTPIVLAIGISLIGIGIGVADAENNEGDKAKKVTAVKSVSSDRWPQRGGNAHRNNVAKGENIPNSWNIDTGDNVLWSTKLGNLAPAWVSSTQAVVADGRVFVGSSNPDSDVAEDDAAFLVCLDQATGKRLWMYRSERLKIGRHQDWPQQAMGSTPCIDGDRAYFMSNRCELVCLDVTNGKPIWKYDMIGEQEVLPHSHTVTSPLVIDDLVLTGTSIGYHTKQEAPSFAAFDKMTGKLVWKDREVQGKVLDGQWSSPAYGVFDGIPQVIFSGGDGWLYSYDVRDIQLGKSNLLWKFDGNPKDSKWILGGRGTRSQVMGSPVIYDGLVYFTMGQQAEHGEGSGHLWCIDPTRRGDISSELLVDVDDSEKAANRRHGNGSLRVTKAGYEDLPISEAGNLWVPNFSYVPLGMREMKEWKELRLISKFTKPGDKRSPKPSWGVYVYDQEVGADRANFVALVDGKKKESGKIVKNPNSGVVWHYDKSDNNDDGEIDFEEEMHRTIASPTIAEGLVFIPDFSGLVHCLDARSGKVFWTHDLFAATYSTPLVVDGKVYVADEDAKVTIFKLSKDQKVINEVHLPNASYCTVVCADDTLYVATRTQLMAVIADAKLSDRQRRIQSLLAELGRDAQVFVHTHELREIQSRQQGIRDALDELLKPQSVIAEGAKESSAAMGAERDKLFAEVVKAKNKILELEAQMQMLKAKESDR